MWLKKGYDGYLELFWSISSSLRSPPSVTTSMRISFLSHHWRESQQWPHQDRDPNSVFPLLPSGLNAGAFYALSTLLTRMVIFHYPVRASPKLTSPREKEISSVWAGAGEGCGMVCAPGFGGRWPWVSDPGLVVLSGVRAG